MCVTLPFLYLRRSSPLPPPPSPPPLPPPPPPSSFCFLCPLLLSGEPCQMSQEDEKGSLLLCFRVVQVEITVSSVGQACNTTTRLFCTVRYYSTYICYFDLEQRFGFFNPTKNFLMLFQVTHTHKAKHQNENRTVVWSHLDLPPFFNLTRRRGGKTHFLHSCHTLLLSLTRTAKGESERGKW